MLAVVRSTRPLIRRTPGTRGRSAPSSAAGCARSIASHGRAMQSSARHERGRPSVSPATLRRRPRPFLPPKGSQRQRGRHKSGGASLLISPHGAKRRSVQQHQRHLWRPPPPPPLSPPPPPSPPLPSPGHSMVRSRPSPSWLPHLLPWRLLLHRSAAAAAVADGFDEAVKLCPDERVVCVSSYDERHFVEPWEYDGTREEAVRRVADAVARLGGVIERDDSSAWHGPSRRLSGRERRRDLLVPVDDFLVQFRSERTDGSWGRRSQQAAPRPVAQVARVCPSPDGQESLLSARRTAAGRHD